MDLPAGLDRKVGPYPLGVWAGLIGGGVAIGLVIRARRKPTASDGTLPTISDANGNPTATAGVATGTGGATSVRTGSGLVGATSNAASTVAADPATNLDWSKSAIRYLVGINVDAAQAQTAIERFMAGYGLTLAEQRLVSQAIAAQGPPPESAPPITTAAEPLPVTPDKPYTAPAPPVEIVGAGSLVSPDGNTVFVTDGQRIRWVQNGNESKALMAAGARVKSIVNEGTPDAFPEPVYMAPSTIRALQLIGPPPPGWPTW